MLVLRLVVLEIIGSFVLGLLGFPILDAYLLDVPYLGLIRVVLFVATVAALVWVTIMVVLKWMCEYYELYPDCVIHRKGIIFQTKERHPLRDMSSCALEQGLFGRLLNYGSINLYDMYNMKHITMCAVHNPSRYFKIITSLIPSAATGRRTVDIPDIGDTDREV